MIENQIVVMPLDGEDAGEAFLLEAIAEAIPAELFPNLTLLPSTPVQELHSLQAELLHGVIFVGMTPAKRIMEMGRLTDLDLWNPREYKHDLLRPWHRALTKAKKQGEIPAHARALFLHHEPRISQKQVPALMMPLVRRIGLWSRFWNNQESSKTPAS